MLLFAFCGFGLVAVDEHRRLRLAPQGLTQSSRVAVLLVGSAYLWLLNAGVLTLMTAMMLNVWDRLELLVPLATDVPPAVAWPRGCAASSTAVLPWRRCTCGHALAHGLRRGLAALGQLLERGPTLAVGVKRRWRSQSSRLRVARWMQRSLYGRSFRPFALGCGPCRLARPSMECET